MRKVKWHNILLFIAPGLVLYGYFFAFSAVNAFYIALTDWNGFSSTKNFVGLANFSRLLTDKLFLTAISNTLLLLVFGGVFVFSLAVLFTYLLTRDGFKMRGFFQNLFYFPNMVTTSALAVIWAFVFNPNFGLLNSILKFFAGQAIAVPWLGSRYSALLCIMVASGINSMGYYLLLLLSAYDKIPDTYREAAVIDGAGEIKVFTKITLPLMRDIFVISISLWTLNTLKSFEFIWALTKGGPANSTHSIGTYLYMISMGAQPVSPVYMLGYGTSMAVVLFVLAVGLVGGFRKIFTREDLQY